MEGDSNSDQDSTNSQIITKLYELERILPSLNNDTVVEIGTDLERFYTAVSKLKNKLTQIRSYMNSRVSIERQTINLLKQELESINNFILSQNRDLSSVLLSYKNLKTVFREILRNIQSSNSNIAVIDLSEDSSSVSNMSRSFQGNEYTIRPNIGLIRNNRRVPRTIDLIVDAPATTIEPFVDLREINLDDLRISNRQDEIFNPEGNLN